MQIKYSLDIQKKMVLLADTDSDKLNHFMDKVKVCKSFDEVCSMIDPVKTKFEELDVFLARVDSQLRVIFTFKNDSVYFLTLIKK